MWHPTVIDEFTKEIRDRGSLRHLCSTDTRETKLLAGRSGYDVVAPKPMFSSATIKLCFPETRHVQCQNLVHFVSCFLSAFRTHQAMPYAVNLYVGHHRDWPIKSEGARDLWRFGRDRQLVHRVFQPNPSQFKDAVFIFSIRPDDILSARCFWADPNTKKRVGLPERPTWGRQEPSVLNFIVEIHQCSHILRVCLVFGFSCDITHSQNVRRK